MPGWLWVVPILTKVRVAVHVYRSFWRVPVIRAKAYGTPQGYDGERPGNKFAGTAPAVAGGFMNVLAS